MWSLQHPSGKFVHITLTKKEIEIGRNLSSDLSLTSDRTVTRQHAKITVYRKSNENNKPDDNDESNTICKIEDLNSKYGTHIIRDKKITLPPNKSYNLEPGDKIRFGAINNINDNNIWTLKYTKIDILICGHPHDNKNLIAAIENIGGVIFYECSNKCSHYLSMCTLMTSKFIFAVINGLPITGKNYWEDFIKAVKQNAELPDVNNYIITNDCLPPEFRDAPIYPTIDRKHIFDGLNFIFLSPFQCNNYGFVIKAAGGKVFLYHRFTFDTHELFDSNMIIVDCSDNDRNQQLISEAEYNALQIAIREKKIRMIHCVEILGAILFCSVNKYCNPMMKSYNEFWQNPRPKKIRSKQKGIESSGNYKNNAIEDANNRENQEEIQPSKIVNGFNNVPRKEPQSPSYLSDSPSLVSEENWIDIRPSQINNQQPQSASTSGEKKRDNAFGGETSGNECGKSSSKNNNKNSIIHDKKSSKDKQEVGASNKIYQNSVKETIFTNHGKNESGKSSVETVSENSKKSSKDNNDVRKQEEKKRKDNEFGGETSGNECGKSSSKNSIIHDKKSSKDKQEVGASNKIYQNSVKETIFTNHGKNESGKSSVETVSENSKKSSKDNNAVRKEEEKKLYQANKSVAGSSSTSESEKSIANPSLRNFQVASKNSEEVVKPAKKNLSRDNKSAAESRSEVESGKSSVKTSSAVQEVGTKRTLEDVEDEKLAKRRPKTLLQTEVRCKKKFESIVDVIDQPKKKISKDQNFEKLFEHPDLDNKEPKKDLNQNNRGIKILSNVTINAPTNKYSKKVSAPCHQDPSESTEKNETSNKKCPDKSIKSGVKNFNGDKLENVAGTSDNTSKKQSESREDVKFSKKRKAEEDKISEAPDKSAKKFQFSEKEFDAIIATISLDDSYHNNTQYSDHDYFKTDKKSGDISDTSKNSSISVENGNIEAGLSNVSEEIFDSSSASEKSETGRRLRKRNQSIESPEKRYNLRSQQSVLKITKVDNHVDSLLASSNDMPMLTPVKLRNHDQLSKAREKLLVDDQDVVNPSDPLRNDNEDEAEENFEDFPESQIQDDFEFVKANVDANSESLSSLDDAESAILHSQADISCIIKENNIKADYKVDDNNASSTNRLPNFFFKNKRRN